MTSHHEQRYSNNPEDHSRRCEFAGARIQVGGRRAAFFQARQGRACGMRTTSTTSIMSNSWGPIMSGHCHPEVVKAVRAPPKAGLWRADRRRTRDGRDAVRAVAVVRMVRLVSSGTEATMTAIRLARGFTGRSRIIKFEGCYHGHCDGLLVKAVRVADLRPAEYSGVPAEIAALTTVLDYNDAGGWKEPSPKSATRSPP